MYQEVYKIMSSANVQYWVDTNVVELANASIIRPFSIDPNWTTIQLGVWSSFTTGSQVTLTGPPFFCFGLCSGATNVLGDAVTTHFLGFRVNSTMGYTSSSLYTAEYYSSVQGIYFKKVNTTITSTGDIISSTLYYHIASPPETPKSSVNYLQITKGSPNYTIKTYFSINPTNVTEGLISEGEFLAQLQSSVPASQNNMRITPALTSVLAVDESADGYFDHVNIFWDREEPVGNVLVYGVGLAVLA